MLIWYQPLSSLITAYFIMRSGFGRNIAVSRQMVSSMIAKGIFNTGRIRDLKKLVTMKLILFERSVYFLCASSCGRRNRIILQSD